MKCEREKWSKKGRVAGAWGRELRNKREGERDRRGGRRRERDGGWRNGERGKTGDIWQEFDKSQLDSAEGRGRLSKSSFWQRLDSPYFDVDVMALNGPQWRRFDGSQDDTRDH